jgi:hypothetical protein
MQLTAITFVSNKIAGFARQASNKTIGVKMKKTALAIASVVAFGLMGTACSGYSTTEHHTVHHVVHHTGTSNHKTVKKTRTHKVCKTKTKRSFGRKITKTTCKKVSY